MNARLVVRRYAGVVFAVAIAAALQIEVWTSSAFRGDRLQSAVACVVFGASLLLRTRLPVVPLTVGLACTVTPGLNDVGNSSVLAIGVIGCLYSSGVSTDERIRVGGLGLGLVAVAVSAATADPFSPNDTLWVAAIALAPWTAGRVVRRSRDRAGLLERRALQHEDEREAAAAQATTDERMRIARELHDAVAHALSLIVIQARGGRRMLHRGRSDDVLDGFDTIERAAQEALVEMRRLLGLLRDDTDEALAPRPGLARLPELVSRFEDTGMSMRLEVLGDPYELSAGIDVSAYRIVQEALTNIVRHSSAREARIIISYKPTSIDVSVLDDGRGDGNAADGGHGLLGMQERVSIYGGSMEAGTRAEGGYAVNVRFPIGAAE